MGWPQLDTASRVGLVATVAAVLGLLVPPVGVVSAVAGGAFSGVAAYRARQSGSRNGVALACAAVSVAVILLLIVGSAIYAALD